MHIRLHTGTIGLTLALAFGCSSQNASEDAGADQFIFDASPYIADEGAPFFPPLCSADASCPSDVGVALLCGGNGVCWVEERAGTNANVFIQPSCLYSDNASSVVTTWTGEPCAITDLDWDNRGVRFGSGVPIELCLELLDPMSDASQAYGGVFENGCIWSDGRPVTARAPEVACRAFEPVNGSFTLSFCGGTCGTVGCPGLIGQDPANWLGCAGRSDTRSFGVCTWSGTRCSPDTANSGEWARCAQETFGYGEPCHCMVTYPLSDEGNPQGWRVAGSVCRAYRGIFPDSVECCAFRAS